MSVNTPNVKFDDREVMMMFKRLTGPELKKAELAALRSSANILKKRTDLNFKDTKIGLSIRRKEKITRKNGKKINRIRRIATVKVLKKESAAIVHIMSDYRVKWFEKGTKERRTKGYRYRIASNIYRKGNRRYYKKEGAARRTGSIDPRWFFRDAQNQTERQIFDNLDKEISKAIIKIANKKSN